MSTVNNSTDKVVVQRGSSVFQTSADMSTVNSTDLLLVNRGGTDYKCTFADWQASQLDEPAIQSLTVAEANTSGARFTSKSFTATFAMDDNGNPGSTKAFKAYVLKPDNGEGNFPMLNYLMKFSGITAVSVSGTTVTVTLANNNNLSKLNVGDTVRPLNATLQPDWEVNSTFGGYNGGASAATWAGVFDGGGMGGTESWWYPNSAIPFSSSLQMCGGESGYDDKYASGPGWATGWVRSNGGCQTMRSGAQSFTAIGCRDHRGGGTGGGFGPLLIDGHAIRRNVYNPCGVVTAINTSTRQVTISNGDNNQGSTIGNWTASGNPVLCREYHIANAKRNATDIFNNGQYQTPRVASKLYAVFGANGSITDFQEDDPGWVTLTDQSSPVSLTFPANATSGPCDTDFPAGSRFVVEMRATNNQGTAYVTSNVVTPT